MKSDGPKLSRHQRMAELVESARAGDRAALDELIVTLTPVLWHVARAQGLDRELSADVVQTTWLRFLRSLAGIHNPAALTAWLVTVTRREAWKERRRQLSELSEPGDFFEQRLTPAECADTAVFDHDRRDRLWAAVGRLNPRCRQLLRIVAFADRPCYREVSQALGMPQGSIGPVRGRCLAHLRQLLETENEGEWR
ncbi:sigma-70 family RNA polymerase sigma factor [Amycolatopsis sp.]|uniref:RNA polymerase sigma factor n=1 Tax=Amycolatopsis sp. TaxID=37632 RepID=UPI002D7EF760|nr:sigma-70 family RNA polymerase sigma factor [Amycolatopsis sp.]HET6705339.1 sigma-70 family RNA polymerase sigma factor [Amycolatopsis sp.]